MTHDLVIRGGTIVTATRSLTADLAVSGGKVAQIGQDLRGTRVMDATDRMVMPGGVDPHAHIEQMSGMGQWNADTFETATLSAAMGGTTSVISFAAQAKGQRLRDVVGDYSARAERGAMIDHAFHLTVTDTGAEAFDTDLAGLIAAGHRSLKLFTTYNIALGDADILHVMALARRHGALVCVHAENDGLIQWTKKALLAAGLDRPEHHALSHPRMAEIEAVHRMIRFAEYLDQPVMLFHISTIEAMAAIREARARGVQVRAETCPHYLLMTEEVLHRQGLDGAKWMCSPPQRHSADKMALWHGLTDDGSLDMISSDHAPYRFDGTGKLAAGPGARFDQIANGLPGLETRLPLLFDAMIHQHGLKPETFVRLTATAPAQIYGLQGKGDLSPGMDADIVIWDPARSMTYGDDDLHDNVGYNPWAGRRITGLPEAVFLRGRLIVEAGRCLATPGQGRWIDRPELATRPAGAPAHEVEVLLRAGQ
ncbi:MAG: dihydropyrimidinase [Rhodobacteraceae bacterium]|nr:dihydropyrimidinase [Paracoccaceae bacterium]